MSKSFTVEVTQKMKVVVTQEAIDRLRASDETDPAIVRIRSIEDDEEMVAALLKEGMRKGTRELLIEELTNGDPEIVFSKFAPCHVTVTPHAS